MMDLQLMTQLSIIAIISSRMSSTNKKKSKVNNPHIILNMEIIMRKKIAIRKSI